MYSRYVDKSKYLGRNAIQELVCRSKIPKKICQNIAGLGTTICYWQPWRSKEALLIKRGKPSSGWQSPDNLTGCKLDHMNQVGTKLDSTILTQEIILEWSCREQKKVPGDHMLEKWMTVETGSYSVTQVNQQSVSYGIKAISSCWLKLIPSGKIPTNSTWMYLVLFLIKSKHAFGLTKYLCSTYGWGSLWYWYAG